MCKIAERPVAGLRRQADFEICRDMTSRPKLWRTGSNYGASRCEVLHCVLRAYPGRVRIICAGANQDERVAQSNPLFRSCDAAREIALLATRCVFVYGSFFHCAIEGRGVFLKCSNCAFLFPSAHLRAQRLVGIFQRREGRAASLRACDGLPSGFRGGFRVSHIKISMNL